MKGALMLNPWAAKPAQYSCRSMSASAPVKMAGTVSSAATPSMPHTVAVRAQTFILWAKASISRKAKISSGMTATHA